VRHRRKRDVPRTRGLTQNRPHLGRVAKGDGTSWPSHSVGVGMPPRRPALCMLYEDLGDMEPQPIFGMYPSALIRKILPWLKCSRAEVLHVCSGGLPRGEGIRVDVRFEARPDVLADGRALPIRDSSVAAVMIDPPYTEHYAAELYGTAYPRPSRLLVEAARVVRPNGRIVFVHYITPNPPRGVAFVKAFALSVGFGYPMRALSIYERHQPSLFAEATQ